MALMMDNLPKKAVPKTATPASTKKNVLEDLKRYCTNKIFNEHNALLEEPLLEVTSSVSYDALSPALGFIRIREYNHLLKTSGDVEQWSVITGGHPQGQLKGKSLQYWSIFSSNYESPVTNTVVKADSLIVDNNQQELSKKAASPLIVSLSTVEQFVRVCLTAKYITYVYVDAKDILNLKQAIETVAGKFTYFALLLNTNKLQKFYMTAKSKVGSSFVLLRVVPLDLVYPKGIMDLYGFSGTYFELWGITTSEGIYKSFCRYIATDSVDGAIIDDQRNIPFEYNSDSLKIFANSPEKEALGKTLMNVHMWLNCSVHGKSTLPNAMTEVFSPISGI